MASPLVFIEHLIRLTEAEMAAEADEAAVLSSTCAFSVLEQHGVALGGLVPANVSVGLGGRTIVALERSAAHASDTAMPPHSFRPGDTVQLEDAAAAVKREKGKRKAAAPAAEESAIGATVWRVSDSRISVSLDKREDQESGDLPGNLRMLKLSNPATYKRQIHALRTIARLLEQDASLPRLVRVLLGLDKPLPETAPDQADHDRRFFDSTLNQSQREAVSFALRSELSLVWGPPGTGKTQTLTEVIRQLVAQGQRVLVCGGSNLSVDNVLQRLSTPADNASAPIPVTRLGHPARVLSSLARFTLDAQTSGSDTAELVADIKLELEQLEAKLRGTGKERIRGSARKDAWQSVRDLRRDYRQREVGIVETILKGARVVVGTTHGVGSSDVSAQVFDAIVIDEAAQASEPACWIPIALQAKASKLILAGDHLQLPPTVRSSPNGKMSVNPVPGARNSFKGAAELVLPSTLESTLFERLVGMYGPGIRKMLNVSYRFSNGICAFPSKALYENNLVSHSSVADRKLSDLPDVEADEDLDEPLVFYDTADLAMLEREGQTGLLAESKSNDNEADICVRYLEKLVDGAKVPASSVTVVSPYNAQVALLSASIRPRWPEVEVGSIDGLQGRENDVVVISLVRSNDKGEVGFLKDRRRMNVAMTRPRRQLVVVGDSATIAKGGGEYLKAWMAYLEEHALVLVPS